MQVRQPPSRRAWHAFVRWSTGVGADVPHLVHQVLLAAWTLDAELDEIRIDATISQLGEEMKAV